MTGSDLYREVSCVRCGNKKLKSASFCPYCGHVEQEHWWDRILDRLRAGGGAEEGAPSTRPSAVSALIGVAIAGYFLYNAVQKESVQSLIIAVLTLIFALRAWFGSRSGTEQSHTEEPAIHETSEDADPVEDKFFCENCGARVAQDATECPKCGMKFG